MLLRCNNHTLNRMHVNRYHHAVSRCGEEISKGKLGSATVTMDAFNSERLINLNIESSAVSPTLSSPRDRDIHLACSDINLQQTLDKAHYQHLPLIQRLRTRSLRGVLGISRNNKITLYVIILGVGGQQQQQRLRFLNPCLWRYHPRVVFLFLESGAQSTTSTP
jgi:hypothetical protein